MSSHFLQRFSRNRAKSVSTRLVAIVVVAVVALTSGCASVFFRQAPNKQSASIVNYLYPSAAQAPQLKEEVVTLRPPVRIGLAFVPEAARGSYGAMLSEVDRLKLLERVRDSFTKHPYIGAIEIIPTQYLQQGGGFANAEQVARMFNVEVMAFVSYDQVQFNDNNALSFLYWTIVGAYVVHGDQYDIRTMLDVSVFDVASQKLLLRAPGVSQIAGSAPAAGFTERARNARIDGYNKAADTLIPQLQTELDKFRERIKTDATVRVAAKQGYKGGGSVDAWLLGAVVLLLGVAFVGRSVSMRSRVSTSHD
jgi:rhombotail lipoprotein